MGRGSKLLKIGSGVLAVAVGLIAFQNFRWVDLLRGGLDDEGYEFRYYNSQFDWLASIQQSKNEFENLYTILSNDIHKRLPVVAPAAPRTPPGIDGLYSASANSNLEASVKVASTVRSFILNSLAVEKKKDLDPVFYFLQDEIPLQAKLPTRPFNIQYGEFNSQNNTVNKGNEEWAMEIIEWRWNAMFFKQFVARGGTPYALMTGTADPEPMINLTNNLIAQVNRGAVPAYLNVVGTVITPLPARLATHPDATVIQDLVFKTGSAFAENFQLYMFLAEAAKQHQGQLDLLLSYYARLGVAGLGDYYKARPNLYNGEDINPVLFKAFRTPPFKSQSELLHYLKVMEGEATPQKTAVATLREQKAALEAAFGNAKTKARIAAMKACVSNINRVSSGAAATTNLKQYVASQRAFITATMNACVPAIPKPTNYLDKLPSVNKAHRLLLEYALRQKAIEDKYIALLAALRGSPVGDFLNMVEQNGKMIADEIFNLPDAQIVKSAVYERVVGPPHNSVTSYYEVPRQAPAESKLDLASSFRRLVMGTKTVNELRALSLPVVQVSSSSGTLPGGGQVSVVRSATLPALINAYKDVFECKRIMDDFIGDEIKAQFQSRNYQRMNEIINLYKLSDISAYCIGDYWKLAKFPNFGFEVEVGKKTLFAEHAPAVTIMEPLRRPGGKEAGGQITNPAYYMKPSATDAALHYKMNMEVELKKVMSGLGITPMFSSPAPGRITGSYSSDPCGKSVLEWQRNANAAVPPPVGIPSQSGIHPGYIVFYNKVKNERCFGVKDVRFAFRSEKMGSLDVLSMRDLVTVNGLNAYYNQALAKGK